MSRRALLASVAVPAVLAGWTLTASAIFLFRTHLWNAFPWSEKAWAWWIYLPYWQDNQVVATWLMRGALGGIAAVAAVRAAIAYQAQTIPKRRPWRWPDRPFLRRGVSDNHGHAEWATPSEIKRRFPGQHPECGGVAVGELYRPDLDRGAGPVFDEKNRRTWGQGGKKPLLLDDMSGGFGGIMVAGSGSYKTQCAISSAFTWTSSAVILDPKGKLGARLRRVREAMGHRVFILKPGVTGPNILDWIDIRDPLAETHVKAVVSDICHEDRYEKRSDVNAFYSDLARSLIVCLLAHMLWDKSCKHKTLPWLRTGICRSGPELKKALRHIQEKSESSLARDLASSLVMDNEAEETFENIRATANRYTEWLSVRPFADLVSGNAFRTSDIASGNVTVFVEIPLATLQSTPQVARGLIGSLMGAMYRHGSPDRRTLFIIDEAKQVGRLHAMEVSRDAGRESGIAMMPIYQSLGQIQEVWGKDGAQSWFASAAWYSFAAIGDAETAELVSKLCGEHSVMAYSEGQNSGFSGGFGMNSGSQSRGKNTNIHEIKRRLITPAELMQDVRADEQFVFSRGCKPMRMGRPISFRRPEMTALLEEPS